MGWYLIASQWLDLIFWFNVLKVVIGLGMVIFVHELGHFIVAKLCGVKCEKFYLGFDIGGLKLWKFTRGETEYGIGILPLGGYVKMLGQEDNPARLREEMERAKLQQAQAASAPGDVSAATAATAATAAAAPQPQSSGDPCGAPCDGSSQPVQFDPRSFLAQSVGKRMAIISAGVVMNVVFAFVMGTAAYGLGVFHIACGVGGIIPGAAAWQTNFKVGDRIVAIDGKPVDRFVDLRAVMAVGDVEGGVRITIARPGVPEPFTVTVYPRKTGPVPTIGIIQPESTALAGKFPVRPGSSAAGVSPGFQRGDQIVEIDGHPIANYGDVYRRLALEPEKTLKVTALRSVPRPEGSPDDQPPPPPRRVWIDVPPMPMKHLGLVMPMGPIAAIQADSPAERAGLQAGDLIERVDGQPVGPAWDGMTLAERLRVRALQANRVKLSIRRQGRPEPIDVEVPLRRADWYEVPLMPGNPMSAPALGIAYQIPLRIEQVQQGGPAALMGIQGGETIVRAELIPPDPDTIQDEKLKQLVTKLRSDALSIDLTGKDASWPHLFFILQEILPGMQVKLTLDGGGEYTLEPADSKDWFNPDRGLQFEHAGSIVRGDSLLSAIQLGARETADSMTLVFRFLKKIHERARALGGPWTIAQMAYGSASEGMAEFYLFLMLISANLAVVNFLPIPILDGGHMVFLTYEGITGKPPGERVYIWLTYVGLVIILALMVWVLGLDFGLISRR